MQVSAFIVGGIPEGENNYSSSSCTSIMAGCCLYASAYITLHCFGCLRVCVCIFNLSNLIVFNARVEVVYSIRVVK